MFIQKVHSPLGVFYLNEFSMWKIYNELFKTQLYGQLTNY